MSDSLIERLLKAGSSNNLGGLLVDSPYFSKEDMTTTSLPVLNIAFTGSLDGGLVPGLTMLAGASKSFKSLLALYCLKAYFDKHPEAVCIFYDSEFGTPPKYLASMGIDANRIIHIPVEHVEQLKFDMVKKLEGIKRGDKVFFFIDSLGNLASKKEIDDAIDEKGVVDMTRAKAIRSLLRIITPVLTMKSVPCIIINHVYQTMETYSQIVIPGGTAATYAPNQIFVITKSQEKDSKTNELVGWNFTINIQKSRFVREKAKLSFLVEYKTGISKYSGLMENGLESGLVIKPKVGWYQKVDPETGEILEKNYRYADTLNKGFWEPLLKSKKFQEFITNKYALNEKVMQINEED